MSLLHWPPATCRTPSGRFATCCPPTSHPVACQAPTGHLATCHTPTGCPATCPATCHALTGHPATCHAPTPPPRHQSRPHWLPRHLPRPCQILLASSQGSSSSLHLKNQGFELEVRWMTSTPNICPVLPQGRRRVRPFRPHPDEPGGRRHAGRGLHLSTFRLNLSAFCGIGGTLRRCLGCVQGVSGGIRGRLGCMSCREWLRLS